MRRLVCLGLALCGLTFTLNSALAQTWPDRPLRMVVPWPPGGANDILGRSMAERIGARLGQPVVVDNRGGSNGVLGADQVAKARPDGTTLMFHSVTSHVTNPAMIARLPYDTMADFAPVSVVANVPLVVVVNPREPMHDLAALIARAKADPGRLSYASFGNGSPSHLAGELFNRRLRIEMQHVPYRGGVPALTDTIAGQIPVYFASLATALEAINTGGVRALAVTGARRAPALSNVPTVEEAANLAGYDMVVAYGLWTTAGTPSAIVERLYEATRAVMQEPSIIERFRSQGAQDIEARSPTESARIIASNAETWGRIAREARATVE